LLAACRIVAKRYRDVRGGQQPYVRWRPPRFAVRDVAELDAERWRSPAVDVVMSRPSWFGAKLAFLWGQHPMYTIEIDGVPEELRIPLPAFPGKLDWSTSFKKNVLFTPFVIGVIRYFLMRASDRYEDLPALAALEMLTPSQGQEHDAAMLYNCVVTLAGDNRTEVRITSLKNRDPSSRRSQWVRMVNWLMAKHVLVSGYDPNTVYACELWTYSEQSGEVVLCVNRNSGTYKPDAVRMEAFAEHLRKVFGVRVRTYPGRVSPYRPSGKRRSGGDRIRP
jgi:hypothetical protein